MTNLLLTFIILNILNVIIQTVKSIATIKCGKGAAALVNAVAYGLYTVVTVYMMCELDLWLKALIVALANLVGVYVVKLLEEKSRKDKLWKVEATVLRGWTKELHRALVVADTLDVRVGNIFEVKVYCICVLCGNSGFDFPQLVFPCFFFYILNCPYADEICNSCYCHIDYNINCSFCGQHYNERIEAVAYCV